ncbi:MucBP domain-containing protein [Lactiplantibacillus nangangensis]|uniref:MucBP domain-containing protein n=1 Tax=Lactiplantibacillus nangangensis TaxID=2559917 RepID=A0ABW1SMM5_9LACO|nr:MucBP domain-containing protein [Lactiplantibacillus nangangensis]
MQQSETKRHYKMYKKGKMWVIMGMVATMFVMGNQIEVLAATEKPADQTMQTVTVTDQEQATGPANLAQVKNDSATKDETEKEADVATGSAIDDSASLPTPESNQPAEQPAASEASTNEASGSTASEAATSGTGQRPDSGATSATSGSDQPATSTSPTESESTSNVANSVAPEQATSATTEPAEVPASSALKEPALAASAKTETPAPVTPKATVAPKQFPRAEVDINTWMPDKNFQQVTLWVINKELGLGLTDVAQITQAMMSQLKLYFITTEHQEDDRDFYFAVMNTVSLKGFEYATNVEKLWFTPNLDATYKWEDKYVVYGKLKDISALKGLTNLTEINVQLNDIEDISSLAGLHLQDLSLAYNHIYDFSPLASSLPTLSSAVTIANQKVVLKDKLSLNIDPKTGKLVTSSFAFGKDKSKNLSIKPVASADADGINLTDTTIEWTNFKQSGYLKYQWHDEWMGAQGYPCDGYVWIPFEINNDDHGSIQIEFIDENGQHLGSDIFLNRPLETTYDVETDQQVLARLQALKGQHYGIKTIQGSPNWTVSQTMGHLRYVLGPVRPAVNFQVVDDAGQPLPTVTIPSKQGNYNDDWQLTIPTVPGYEFVQATVDGQLLAVTENQLKGRYTEDQTIQLTYRRKSEKATLHFKYEDGTSAGDSIQLAGKYGEAIQFPAIKEIPGYFADDLVVAYYQDGENSYTVIYRKAGQVMLQYVDEAGKKISAIETMTGKVGSNYQTQAKAIAGYTLVGMPVNQNGQFSKQPTTVVYRYVKDAITVATGQPVTVQYVDETGQSLAIETVLNGKVGENYQATAAVIDGYELIQVVGNPSGNFSEQAQTITFKYRKIAPKTGSVTIHYVTETGKTLAESVVLTGEIGSAYETAALKIAGYRLKDTQGAVSGHFEVSGSHLTFVYEALPVVTDPGQSGTGDNSEGDQVRPLLKTKPIKTRTEAPDLQPLSSASDPILPQTDEQQIGWFKVLGTVLLGLVAYVCGRKRQ